MKYIIISLKHGTGKKPMFWRANNAGYTSSPFVAGIYTEEQVKTQPNYYNDGYSAVAIPLTDQAMDAIGFTCSFNEKAIEKFFQKSKSLSPPQGKAVSSINMNTHYIDPKEGQAENQEAAEAPTATGDTQATEEATSGTGEGE